MIHFTTFQQWEHVLRNDLLHQRPGKMIGTIQERVRLRSSFNFEASKENLTTDSSSMVNSYILTAGILALAFTVVLRSCNETTLVVGKRASVSSETINLQVSSDKVAKVFQGFAPTSYSLLPRTQNYGSYPAKVEATETFLSWEEFQLPESLPVHGLRLKNKMPQLGILLDPSKLPKGPTSGPSNLPGGPTDFPYWPQTYEPVFPDYVETDKLYDLPKECIMTAPRKEKGLRIIKVTHKGASSPVSLAWFPFIGPYGSDTKEICFPENSRTMSTLGGKIDWEDKGERGVLDRSGYLQSFHPGGADHTTMVRRKNRFFQSAG